MEKIRIAIIGYGSMGKEIERLAASQSCEIAEIFDLVQNPLSEQSNFDFDVAIDFSNADGLAENLRILAKMKKNIVVGTTGWQEKSAEIFDLVRNSGIGVVHSTNFSVGMHIFKGIVSLAAELADKFENYDVFMHEIHHKRKADSPSGTALNLAQIILGKSSLKKELLFDAPHTAILPEQFHISSSRGGEIAGTHTVFWDSFADTIELTHRAKNRSGFALGALLAAHWIKNKQGIYDFKDIFNSL